MFLPEAMLFVGQNLITFEVVDYLGEDDMLKDFADMGSQGDGSVVSGLMPISLLEDRRHKCRLPIRGNGSLVDGRLKQQCKDRCKLNTALFEEACWEAIWSGCLVRFQLG